MRALLLISFCVCARGWTVDLPARRQQLFPAPHDPAEEKVNEGSLYYNNYYSASPYDSAKPQYIGNVVKSHPERYRETGSDGADDEEDRPLYEGQPYAEEYEYHSYMEKKVHDIVKNGTRYLEGLKDAIEQYILVLEDCSNVTVNDQSARYSACAGASARGDQVRRVAQMAAHTAAKMRDHHDYQSEFERHAHKIERRALLMRLAMFLDRLAELTGYEPRAPPRETPTTSTAAPPPPPSPPAPSPPLPALSPAERARLVACLGGAADADCEALTQRIRDMLDNISEPPSTAEPRSVSVLPPRGPSPRARRSPPAPPTTPAPPAPPAPLGDVVKYYAKYRAWTNVNPDGTDKPVQHEFTETNHVQFKRSIDPLAQQISDIGAYLTRRFGLLDSIQNGRDSIQHKRNSIQKRRDSIQHKRDSIQNGRNSIQDGGRKARSVRPRIPEDPMQDISYVAKTRPGVTVQRDAQQAARVRLGLQQHYRTGSLEVIRRFGSNYNPAVPDHVLAGVLVSTLDF